MSKIKIGGLEFDIIFEKLGNSCGDCNVSLRRIKIDPTIEIQESTLLHEIIEVINELYELNLPHKTISILETALYQVYKDNYDKNTSTSFKKNRKSSRKGDK